MTDSTTQQRITIDGDASSGYDVIIPVSQLDSFRAVLDENHIPFWVDAEVLSIDSDPEVAFVNFNRKTDAAKVQRLLDSLT